mmetsp:Transcript_2478/g.7322  ORF Transcript_2478/g.7322 Transcript_2478/m.7322 type:complete len:371 (-) Transcript_2478:1255-2367(-)
MRDANARRKMRSNSFPRPPMPSFAKSNSELKSSVGASASAPPPSGETRAHGSSFASSKVLRSTPGSGKQWIAHTPWAMAPNRAAAPVGGGAPPGSAANEKPATVASSHTPFEALTRSCWPSATTRPPQSRATTPASATASTTRFFDGAAASLTASFNVPMTPARAASYVSTRTGASSSTFANARGFLPSSTEPGLTNAWTSGSARKTQSPESHVSLRRHWPSFVWPLADALLNAAKSASWRKMQFRMASALQSFGRFATFKLLSKSDMTRRPPRLDLGKETVRCAFRGAAVKRCREAVLAGSRAWENSSRGALLRLSPRFTRASLPEAIESAPPKPTRHLRRRARARGRSSSSRSRWADDGALASQFAKL